MNDNIKVIVRGNQIYGNEYIAVIELRFSAKNERTAIKRDIKKMMNKVVKDMKIERYNVPEIYETHSKENGLFKYKVDLCFMIAVEWFYFQFFKDIIGNYISDNYLR